MEVLKTYFSSISCVNDSGVQLPDMYSVCNSIIDNIVIWVQEIIDIIIILPWNKAVGPDDISHKMLKSTMYTIVTTLC